MKNKLSDRLRPNSECAPWVLEEVKKLEKALETTENTKPIGKVLSEDEMGIGYDRKAGNVVWFGTPSPGFIYSHSAPASSERLTEALCQIQHSMKQAQIPGNDARREIKLTEEICRQALAAHATAQPVQVKNSDTKPN